MAATSAQLVSFGLAQHEADAIISDAAADLPAFKASTHLTGELRDSVCECAAAKVMGTPVIAFASLERTRGTLDDFARTYLPLHGLEGVDIVRYLPELAFVEALIYAMDEENESMAASLAAGQDSIRQDTSDSNAVLLGVLEARGLLDERIESELARGRQFWALERALCGRVSGGRGMTADEVLHASALKSFDYRVLNLLVYKLRGVEVDERTVAFLHADELLTDIADDLFDYEDDVLKGAFNIFRMLVHAVGADAAPTLLAAHISKLEAVHAARMAELETGVRERFQQRMHEVFRRRGTRTWQMPTPITDEVAYRCSVAAEAEAASSSSPQPLVGRDGKV